MTRWLCLPLVAASGCFNTIDTNPRTTKELRLYETRIDRNKNEQRHTQYALRKFGENIVFAVRGDVTRTFGFNGQRTDAFDSITYDLADRQGVSMVLSCKVETIAVHPRDATFTQRAPDDEHCDGRLEWSAPASISMRVLICDQKDAAEKPTSGMYWHAGPLRLAPGPGVESVVEHCAGDDAAVFDVGYRAVTP